MIKQQRPRSERLKEGAAFLGKLWAVPENRCPNGWTIDPCHCQPARSFCKARNLWVTLAIEDWMAALSRGDEDGRDLDDGPFGLALSMIASEWDATVLALKVEHPKTNVVVGSGKSCVMTMMDMAKLRNEPAALEAICVVMNTFENSKVSGIESSTPTPPADDAPSGVVVGVEANPDEAFE